MAIDSAAKRYSVLNMRTPHRALPPADGSVGRRHILKLYAGIAIVEGNALVILVDPVLFGDYYVFIAELEDDNSGNTQAQMFLDPAYNANGSDSEDVSAQGSNVFAYAGLFKDSVPLMPVFTENGTTQSINSEDLTGTLGAWFGPDKGSMVVHCLVIRVDVDQVLWQFDDGTENNRIRLECDSAGDIHFIVTDGGVSQCDLNLGSVSNMSIIKVAARWASESFGASLDGAAVQTNTTPGTTIPSVTTARIGGDTSGSHLFGGMTDATYLAELLSDSELMSRTS